MTIHEVVHQKMKIHDVLSIVAIVVCVFGWWNAATGAQSKGNASLTANLTNLTETVSKLGHNQELLSAHLEDIDQKGTQASQAANRLALQANIEQDRRINGMDAQLATLVPDLREIRTKLNFVAELLDERTRNKR